MRIVKRGGIGVECGVFEGDFSKVLWKTCRPSKLFLIDTWDCAVKLQRPSMTTDGIVWRDVVSGGQDSFNVVQKWATSSARKKNSIRVVKYDSVSWLRTIPAHSIDWIYLDSDHTFEHLTAELYAASMVVKPGGWIMGHDWTVVLPGVAAAVSEWVWKTGRTISYLTDEKPAPVWPRAEWMPEFTKYRSWAVRA